MKMLKSALAAVAVALTYAACSDTSGPDLSAIDVGRDSVELWVGDKVTLVATVTNSKGDAVRTPVEWKSLTPVAQVDQNGVIQALNAGRGEIRITSGALTKTLIVIALPVIRGRIYSPASSDFSSLTVQWRAGNNVAGGNILPSGQFTIRVAKGDNVGELLIDAPEPRAFHPFLYPLNLDSTGNLAIVMVPKEWTIKRGIYAGQRVPIDLDLVMDEPTLNPYFYSYVSEDNKELIVDENSWPLDQFPVKVAIDHRNSDPDVTPADSAEVWSAWNRMEEIFGIDMFQAVPADPAWWPNVEVHPVAGVIRFRSERETVAGGSSQSTLPPTVWRQQLGSWAAGGRFTTFTINRFLNNAGEFVLGTEEFPTDRMPPRTVYQHEMMHILGVGHTSKIPSTQGPAMRTLEPSKYDVAYVELIREISSLERNNQTFLGLMPATIGERRIILNKPALPTLSP